MISHIKDYFSHLKHHIYNMNSIYTQSKALSSKTSIFLDTLCETGQTRDWTNNLTQIGQTDGHQCDTLIPYNFGMTEYRKLFSDLTS